MIESCCQVDVVFDFLNMKHLLPTLASHLAQFSLQAHMGNKHFVSVSISKKSQTMST